MYCIGTSGPTEGMVPARPHPSSPPSPTTQVLWSFTVPGFTIPSPAPCAVVSTAVIDPASSTLYFTSLFGGLFALNMSIPPFSTTSPLLWQYNASLQQLSGAPVLSRDASTIYYARHPTRPIVTISHHLPSHPLIPAQHLTPPPSNDFNVYAVSTSAGTQMWNFSTNGIPASPAIGSGSGPYLFVASADGFLYTPNHLRLLHYIYVTICTCTRCSQ